MTTAPLFLPAPQKRFDTAAVLQIGFATSDGADQKVGGQDRAFHYLPTVALTANTLPGGAATSTTGAPQSTTRIPLPNGFELDDLEIIKLIGEGGFSLTYLAREKRIGSHVALKELFPAGARRADGGKEIVNSGYDQHTYEWIEYFFSNEAKTLDRLRHQGIVRGRSFKRHHSTYYIAMEYVPGADFRTWRTAHFPELTQGELVPLIDRILKAMHHMHDKRIIHRDIKPSNILIHDSDAMPVIIDLGSAIEIGAPAESMLPMATDGFSAPEQYSNNLQDERTDIYGLGATLYWLLSGRRPPTATRRLTRDRLVPLERYVDPPHRFPERLLNAIAKSLSVDPAQRQRNAEEFFEDISPRRSLRQGYQAKPRGKKIFISYRREDAPHFSGRLLDFLEMRFGTRDVFYDINSIPIGGDFWDSIVTEMSECAAVVVVIGTTWEDEFKNRNGLVSRLLKRRDYVVEEIASALELELPVIPVLVDGARMPARRALPQRIQPLISLNGALFADSALFRSGARTLCEQIEFYRNQFDDALNIR